MASKDHKTLAAPATPVNSQNGGFHHLRFVIISAGGLAMGFMLFLRLTITVTMVGMVNHTQIFMQLHSNATEEELKDHFRSEYIEVGEFDWNNDIQERLISFYMITYTAFQFFSTRLTMRCGLRIGIAASLAVCALSNVLTPVVAYWGWQWVLALRLINGCAASGIYPGMVCLIERWTPKREHAKGVVLFQFTSGAPAVVTPVIAGYLASIHWKWAYYVPGAAALVFCLLWCIFVSDGPKSSKFISQKELNLIVEDSSGNTESNDSKAVVDDDKDKVPYYLVFKTREFYFMTIIWCLYCASSGGFIYLVPTYLHRVLQLPVEEIGMLTFIAQIGSLFSMLWPNPLVDFFMKKFKFTLTSARQAVVFICKYILCEVIL